MWQVNLSAGRRLY